MFQPPMVKETVCENGYIGDWQIPGRKSRGILMLKSTRIFPYPFSEVLFYLKNENIRRMDGINQEGEFCGFPFLQKSFFLVYRNHSRIKINAAYTDVYL